LVGSIAFAVLVVGLSAVGADEQFTKARDAMIRSVNIYVRMGATLTGWVGKSSDKYRMLMLAL